MRYRRAAIQAQIAKAAKGLSLYNEAMHELDREMQNAFNLSLNDVVADDEERQDKVMAIVEGISVTADELIEWGAEVKERLD